MMKSINLTLIAATALIIAACNSSKKSSTSTVSSTPASNTTTTNSSTSASVKPANGIYEPGNEELNAIRSQYKDVTLEKLKEGHSLYTAGACTNCHGAKNIYKREESQWKMIIDDMAVKAHITDNQKDAVYKYVLAIKATQPKEAK